MKYLKVFTDFNLDIESLSYEEKGRLFEAMLAYAKDQTVLPLPGNERFNWGTAKKQIDAQQKSYESKCENISKARDQNPCNNKLISANKDLKSANKQLISAEEQEQEQEKEQEQNKRHKGSKRFAAPTADQVREYCLENGYSVDPERFVNHYTSNGWKVGGKTPMKDWRAAVRNWEQRDKDGNKKAQKNYEQRRITDAMIEHMVLDLDNPDSWE